MKEKDINNVLPFVRFSIPFIMGGFFLTFLSFYFEERFFGILFGLITSFIAFFFRDPERKALLPKNAIVSPADGRILEVKEMGDMIKISIFMSLMDVHVNRIPINGRILKIRHNPGKFLRAYLDQASKENEKNRVLIMPENSDKPYELIQIAGILARRIICWVKEGDEVQKGQRFGLICFGSRVELLIDKRCEIVVQPGQKVKAGINILGYIR